MKKLFALTLLAIFTAGVSSAATQMVRLTRFEGLNLAGISASTNFEVEVYASNETKAMIEIPAELEQYLVFEVNSSGVVRLGFEYPKGGLNFSKIGVRPRAKVYLRDLVSVSASSNAQITFMDDFNTASDFKANASSNGKVIDLDIEASKVSFSSNSNGRISGSFRAKTADLSTNSNGKIEFDVDADELKCNVNSNGAITLRGTTTQINASANSNGKVYGESLDCQTASCSVNSNGKVNLGNIEGVLTAKANSAGSVRYGNAGSTHISVNSGGSVKKI